MSTKISKTLVASAVSGIVLGAFAIGCGSTPPDAAGAAKDPTSAAKACCKGMHDCKGKGGCKTDKHDCKGKNDCKGQGGCNANCPKT